VGSTARGGRVITDGKAARAAEEFQAHRS